MTGIKHNGITVSVQDWSPWKKLPVLVVEFEGENTAYKVASFNSKETAKWFNEVMEEFFKGLCYAKKERNNESKDSI